MRKLIAALLALGLSTPVWAADNYTAKDASGSTLTFGAKEIAGPIKYVQSVPTDSTGALFGVTANPYFITANDGSLITVGAKADAVCGTATGTCSIAALIKFLNAQVSAAIPAGSAIIGKVGIDQTTPGTTNAVQQIPGVSGGLTVYFVQPGGSDNHANIKNGAGQVYKISVTNISATVNYLRLYNAATGFNGCNSATNLIYQMAIPGSTSGAGYSDSWEQGIAFSTGISICVSSGYATTDTTAATASAMSVNIGYK